MSDENVFCNEKSDCKKMSIYLLANSVYKLPFTALATQVDKNVPWIR